MHTLIHPPDNGREQRAEQMAQNEKKEKKKSLVFNIENIKNMFASDAITFVGEKINKCGCY